ncbi:MAG: N-acetyltransferase [Desulfobulbaceae bacterium]|nr:MAG: N-acetyltransferase [Desulfobulbaceae bacterium]
MEIATDTIQIRPFQLTDFAMVFSYMGDEETTHFLPSGKMSEDQVRTFIDNNTKAFAVLLRKSGTLIGHIDFFACFGDHTYEIGWAFNKAYQRKGYAYQAASMVIGYGFEQLGVHRIIATCQPENPPSYKLMERLGMRKEAFFRQCIPKGQGVWWDEYLYALLASEYETVTHTDVNMSSKGG